MTYLLYIDESYDKKSNYVIMAGFSIHLSKWKETNRRVNLIKEQFFPDNPEINLKSIRRKNYEDNKYWEELTQERKNEFNTELYNLICEQGDIIIASLINKNKMDDKNKELFFYLAYSFIIERYQYFLSEKKEEGLVIMDKANNSPEIQQLYNKHKDFLKNGVSVKRDDKTLKLMGKEFILKERQRRVLLYEL